MRLWKCEHATLGQAWALFGISYIRLLSFLCLGQCFRARWYREILVWAPWERGSVLAAAFCPGWPFRTLCPREQVRFSTMACTFVSWAYPKRYTSLKQLR